MLTSPAIARSRARIGLRATPGMTLIEILLVIAVAALLMSGVAFGINALPHTRLRVSAVRLASTFRFAYVHALTTGRTTRVSFPMTGATITVEDTDDAHTLDVHDPFHAGGAADIEATALRDARMMTDLRPRAPRASFRRLPDRQFRARPLDSGITFVRLYSQHDQEPREDGTGHVYFFSGGGTERAVVQLRSQRGEIFSVQLNPLTGRAQVFDRPIEPATIDDRDQLDQQEIDLRERPTEATHQ